VNPKIFVFLAVIALAAVLGVILSSNSSFVSPIPNQDHQVSQKPSQKIKPIDITLDDISITEINERAATIEVKFKINNPNPSSVILQVMDYQLFETGFSNDKQISGGQIGSRPEGMVEFGSNYYAILGGNSILLKDKIILKNTGNTPQLWSTLESGTAKWRVTGDVFFNLSSMTTGQENEIHFDLAK
jgi:hypothetical protein